MRTPIVCGMLMAPGIATAEGAELSFGKHRAAGLQVARRRAMDKNSSETFDVDFCAGTISAIVSPSQPAPSCASQQGHGGQICR
jgi:hypothetical protein